jgi:hypothetical protein
MAQFSAAQLDILNRHNPDFQAMAFGDKVGAIETSLASAEAGQTVAYTVEKAADFTTAVALFVAPFAMRIVDVIVEAHHTEGSGTVKILKGTDEICTAIACATDGAVSHMAAGATIATTARRTLATGDTVNIQAAGGTAANIKGRVTVVGVKL